MSHKHLAKKIVNRIGERYEKIMSTIKCTISFLILQSCSICIKESRPLQKSQLVNDLQLPTIVTYKCVQVEEHSSEKVCFYLS